MAKEKRVVIISIAITLIMILSGCNRDVQPETAEIVEPTQDEVVEEVVTEEIDIPEEEEITEEEELIVEYTEEEILDYNISVIEMIMVDNFDNMFKVEYDEEAHAFILMIIDNELAENMFDTLLGALPYSIWDELFIELTNLSSTISEYTDNEIMLILVNPFELENAVFVAQDGKQIYNLFE